MDAAGRKKMKGQTNIIPEGYYRKPLFIRLFDSGMLSSMQKAETIHKAHNDAR